MPLTLGQRIETLELQLSGQMRAKRRGSLLQSLWAEYDAKLTRKMLALLRGAQGAKA